MASMPVTPQLSMPSSANREFTRGRGIVLHATIFITAFVVLVSRRPDVILNAQFYAEDGAFWYVDAYRFGLHCLLMPAGGYLNTLSHLIALLTLLFPFAVAPLVMNICAILVQILPVHIFLSSRFDAIPFNTRLLGSFLYLALPNSFEIHATTTNIQWHLALAGCLVLLGRQDSRWGWRVFDFLVLMFLVLDGPLGILLIPIAAILRWIRNDARYNLALVALIPGAVLQGVFLLMTNSRPTAPNGATFGRLASIVGGQVFFSSVLGVRTSIQLYYYTHLHSLFLVQVIALAVGVAFVIYALRYGPMELKLFHLFAVAVLGSALSHPLANYDGDMTQWQQMQVPGCGNRYYFFPMLAFLATIIWMLVNSAPKTKVPRYLALSILLLLPVGICRDWRYKPFKDLHFQEHAAEFERAAPGTQFTIPINPFLWTMQLTKR
jgi:hypothetical protein